MKVWTTVIGLLAVLTPLAAAWSKEDREIFRVRDELAAVLGPEVSFYDFVGVPPSGSLDDINKAYRKKTRSLHPDKVKQHLAAERAKAAKANGGVQAKPPTSGEVRAAVKRASDMQARLGIVTNILRGPMRDRYDHFLSNGFPTWKGTEYYYNRYRPGFGTVMVGLFVFIGGAIHYLTLYMSWKRQREFVDRYIRYARQAAWGNQLANMDLNTEVAPAAAATDEDSEQQQQQAMATNRKMRRMQERDAKREAARDAASNGRRTRRGGAAATTTASATNSGTATPTPKAATTTTTTAGPTGAKRRVTAENGKVLVVDSLGDVYLEQMSAEGTVEELLLDINEVVRPTVFDTAVYRLPVWVYSLTIGRVFGKASSPANDDDELANDNNDDDSSDSSPGKATPGSDSQDELEAADNKAAGAAQASGSSHNKVKANKRKGKKK